MDITAALEGSPSKAAKIHDIANRARTAELLLEAKEHAGMKMLLEQLVARIDSINQSMCWDTKVVEGPDKKPRAVRLTDLERVDLGARRSELLSIVDLFPEAKQKLENLEKKLKSYESH